MADFRGTAKWRTLRAQVIYEESVDNVATCYICQTPIFIGKFPSGHDLSVEIDHVKAHNNDTMLMWARENLAVTHKFCNNMKHSRILTPTLQQEIHEAFLRKLKNDKLAKGKEEGMSLIADDDIVPSSLVSSGVIF